MRLSVSQIAYTLIVLICSVYILIYTEQLLIPIILALIIWYLIKGIRNTMRRITFVKEKFPIWLQSTIAFIMINLIIFMVIEMLAYNMEILTASLDQYSPEY